MFPKQQIDGFEKYWRRRKPGSSTAVHYSSDVRIFFKWALGQSPESITVHDVDWFIEWQQSLGRAPATVRRRLISLRMFYDYLAYIREEQVTNPVIVKRHYVEQGHRLPRNIRKEEIEKLFTAIGDHLRDCTIFTLIREDIPTATAFAYELAGAWEKVTLIQNLQKTVDGTIHTIAATVEARDPYTAGHQKRVSDLAAAIATEMHLSEFQIEGIRMTGIIHDLGKIQVPAEILSKPGKISELEYEIIKTHAQVGFNLLKDIEFPWPIAQMVFQHHENMDGSGYPQGLKGDEIIIEARILTVADIVEAMSSHRPYRPALGIEKSLDQIKKDKGKLLDPDVVDACLKIFKQGYKLPEN
jgi:putative nucleotidyltransferase with HDIG domain